MDNQDALSELAVPEPVQRTQSAIDSHDNEMTGDERLDSSSQGKGKYKIESPNEEGNDLMNCLSEMSVPEPVHQRQNDNHEGRRPSLEENLSVVSSSKRRRSVGS